VLGVVLAVATAGACFGPTTVGTKVPIVPVSQAPAADPGVGWSCYAWTSSAGGGLTSSSCLRTEADCDASRTVLARTVVMGNPYQTGACAAQPTATCRYVWHGATGQHVCYRTDADCLAAQNARTIDDATQQSQCARYP
jgi:hypothetical protein